MAFLPDDYETPKAESPNLKFEQGPNRFRFLGDPFIAWRGWRDTGEGKAEPVWFREKRDITPGLRDVREVWVAIVFAYGQGIKLAELTQTSIKDEIVASNRNPDFGDPTGYDITVTKRGEKKDTKYSVQASPPKDMSDECFDAVNSFEEQNGPIKNIDLSVVLEGKHPLRPDEG